MKRALKKMGFRREGGSLVLPEKEVRAPSETKIMLDAMGQINRIPMCRVFRNNNGALYDRNGRLVKYGLGDGSADLIGSVFVGAFARPLAIEFKKPGETLDPDQEAWRDVVISLGWVYGMATSIEEAIAIVERARQNLLTSIDALTAEYRRGIFDERMSVWQFLKREAHEFSALLADAILKSKHNGLGGNWDAKIENVDGRMQITLVQR